MLQSRLVSSIKLFNLLTFGHFIVQIGRDVDCLKQTDKHRSGLSLRMLLTEYGRLHVLQLDQIPSPYSKLDNDLLLLSCHYIPH